MASRKTGTTQRRTNLLKSMSLRSNGVRNYTTGQFRLGPQTMTEINMTSGRTRLNSYFIVRNDLREILQGRSRDNMLKTFYHGSTGVTNFSVVNGSDSITIGCKRFAGKAADTLRQWALQN